MKTLRTFALAAGLLAAGMTVPASARAQMQLTGTTTTMHAGPGDQVNPQVDCNLASYTDDQGTSIGIRYFDFTTNTDRVVPNPAIGFLSDVSGDRIAFTQASSAAGDEIRVFDTATNTSVTIPGGGQRTNPSIGGSLVAFEDRSFSANPNESEIVVYDLVTNTTTRLTTDALMDTNPAVSPTGNAVVFQKCQTTGFGCSIYVATQIAPGVFSTSVLPGQTGENFNPATNGSVVVYTAARNGETHVYYQPIVGGAETQIPMTGAQRFPSVSGNLIAFESQQVANGQYDIFVYDIASGTVYRATNTPVDETYSDISVCNGIARIVYSAPGANGDFDMFAFTFTPPAASVPFASFTAAVAFDRGPRANDDELRVGAVFTLGSGSNGVNPLTEEVALQVGSFSATIPAGAFRRDRFGLLRFEGSIGGHHVLVILTPLGGGRYAVIAEAETLELPGTRTPVTVALRIGNDAGSVTVTPLID
jgi:hypothetical protein